MRNLFFVFVVLFSTMMLVSSCDSYDREIKKRDKIEKRLKEKYSSVDRIYIDDECAIVQDGGKMGLVSLDGTELTPIIYDDIEGQHEESGLMKVEKDGKFGHINTKGKLVIPIEYEDATFFSDGLAKIKLNGKYGFVNENNQMIISSIYDEAEPFMDGFSRVSIDGKYGIIDTSGKEVLPIIYDRIATPRSQELIERNLVEVTLNRETFYVDRYTNKRVDVN